MNERPILFKSSMVRAILSGKKTQTRRLVKIDDTPIVGDVKDRQRGIPSKATNVRMCGAYVKCDAPKGSTAVSARVECPYGTIGDHLWVRETWHPCDGVPIYAADHESKAQAGVERWKSPLFMTRDESRITLEVRTVRVERLHDVSGSDILAEGVVERAHDDPNLGRMPVSVFNRAAYPDLISLWAAGWDSINGKTTGARWRDNPWIWVISFRRIATKARAT